MWPSRRSESAVPLTRREWLQVVGAGTMVGALTPIAGWRGQTRPDVDLVLTAAPDEVSILPGTPTRVWRFTGRRLAGPPDTLTQVADSYLGPTIRLRRGQRVRIRFQNRLADPSIVHWHGLDVPQEADGHPRLAVPSGGDYVYEFVVRNRAGTYWYHPHPHMQTGPQVYRGLAGLLIVGDEEEAALALPAGAAELTWVLQDRRFDANNQLTYSMTMMDAEMGFLGDRVLVSGQLSPRVAVGTRPYRVRVLNGSNARVYKLAWSDGSPMTVIGVDGGLLDRAVNRAVVTLAPAQRVDVWLDLSQRAVGTSLELRSDAFEAGDVGLVMGRGRGAGFGRGAGRGAGGTGLGAAMTLVSLEVRRRESAGGSRLPSRLSDGGPTLATSDRMPERSVPLTFEAMAWKIGGRTFEMTGVADDETVRAGSSQIWSFVNAGGPMGMQMAHPIHLHGRQFRVVGRSGGDPANSVRDGLIDAGWLDTVLVLPDETVRIHVPFSEFPGLFLYHCHILEHEDMGMMRNFRITP
jgi:FtsP/CotA-like multicopper oxidase with cupredoxin domain